MFDTRDLLGTLMRSGLKGSGERRIEHAVSDRGLGQYGDLLGGLFGGGSGPARGGLSDVASGPFGGLGRALEGNNPLVTGGIGALAGSLLGRGLGVGRGGGFMGRASTALLGSLAVIALQNMWKRKGAGADQPQSLPPSSEVRLGLREPATPDEEREAQSAAELSLRAMINAAKADGTLDGSEVSRILGKLDEAGAGPEEREFVKKEMAAPFDLDGLIRAVKSPEVAAQVYAASLFAIEVDTPAEREYLRKLAAGLGLDDDAVRKLHETLGVPA